jgi:hypothetical protein
MTRKELQSFHNLNPFPIKTAVLIYPFPFEFVQWIKSNAFNKNSVFLMDLFDFPYFLD